MKEYFNFLGFKFNTKKFLITLAVFAGVVGILLIVDRFFFSVSWYGFIMGCGFLIAVVLSSQLMKHRNLPDDFSYDLIWWIFPLSIIFARIAYVINYPEVYKTFYSVIAIWEGGLSIYGGVVGGTLGLIICCLIKKENPICAMDVVAPVLILAQSIGRWGNFINKEVYGFKITNSALQWFPFGVNVNGTWHLATFFYESILDLVGFFILLFMLRKLKNKGIVVSTYLFYYGFIRYFLEGIRDAEFIMMVPGTNMAFSKLASLIYIAIGVCGLIACVVIDIVKRRRNNIEKTNSL